MKFLYSLAFIIGADNWKLDKVPHEILDTLKEFDKNESQILDLGCGIGKESVFLALKGWRVIGIDFIIYAIHKANKAANAANVLDRTLFISADVSKLFLLKLPPIHFAYDIGCFHLLNPDQMECYIVGLNEIIVSGGVFLLNAFTPRQQGKKTVGLDSETVKKLFSPDFELERTSNHSYWRFPANWYWLRRK